MSHPSQTVNRVGYKAAQSFYPYNDNTLLETQSFKEFKQQLLSLYQQRLSLLDQTITDIHRLVLQDDFMKTANHSSFESAHQTLQPRLCQQFLRQDKISPNAKSLSIDKDCDKENTVSLCRKERVKEIVQFAMNCQKEHLLVMALAKCQQLQNQLNQQKQQAKRIQSQAPIINLGTKQLEEYETIIKEKISQNQKLSYQVKLLNYNLNIQRSKLETTQKQLAQSFEQLNCIKSSGIDRMRENQIPKSQNCSSCQSKISQLQEISRERQNLVCRVASQEEQISKLKHMCSKQSVQCVGQENSLKSQQQSIINSIVQQNSKLKSQLAGSQNIQRECKTRSQQVSRLKDKVKFLEEELLVITRNLTKIKRQVVEACLGQVRQVKQVLVSLKNFIKTQISNKKQSLINGFLLKNQTDVQSYFAGRVSNQNNVMSNIYVKMGQIDNQLTETLQLIEN